MPRFYVGDVVRALKWWIGKGRLVITQVGTMGYVEVRSDNGDKEWVSANEIELQ